MNGVGAFDRLFVLVHTCGWRAGLTIFWLLLQADRLERRAARRIAMSRDDLTAARRCNDAALLRMGRP